MKVKDIIKNNTKWIPNLKYNAISPLVTVTMPTYKRAKTGYFEKALKSVLAQEFKNFELIIIDDGSTDGTADIIARYMKQDKRVSCLRHLKNVGLPCIGSFEGYMKARGTYMAYMFDDNIWDKGFLSKTVDYMQKNDAKATYGIARGYDNQGNYYDFQEQDLAGLSATNYIGNGAVMLHREVIERVGFYDPHLALTRLCDWDFWKRILFYYDLEFTGIFACEEYGVTLSDSLGNSLVLSKWTSLEQTQRLRNEQLKPSNFLDYDVCFSDEKSTNYFKDIVYKLCENYSDKYWFNSEDPSLKQLRVPGNPQKTLQRILLLLPNFDATFLLGFNRLQLIDSSFIFLPVHVNNFTELELVYADAVIVSRDILSGMGIAESCKKYNIPIFYFLDDNFIVLAEDDPYFSTSAAKIFREERLDHFTGVITSCEKIKQVMEDLEVHNNISIFRPIFSCAGTFTDDEIITFAFMGGGFREDLFLEVVLPAIYKVSKEYKVRLVCPTTVKSRVYKKYMGDIDFVYIDRLFSVETILHRFKKHAIDFLIHCGPEIKNNEFKTENSLINAVQLGASLITSKVSPYVENSLVFCAENTIHDWTQTIFELISRPELIEQNKAACIAYCQEKYSPEANNQRLSFAMQAVRTRCLSENLLVYDAVAPKLAVENYNYKYGAYNTNCEAFVDKTLSFSKFHSHRAKYKITLPPVPVCKLGMIFSVDGTIRPEGRVSIHIYKGTQLLAKSEAMDISNITLRAITYFTLDNNITDSCVTVEIVPDFAEVGAKINEVLGVYENRAKKTFFCRLLHKIFGVWIRGDILFCDVR